MALDVLKALKVIESTLQDFKRIEDQDSSNADQCTVDSQRLSSGKVGESEKNNQSKTEVKSTADDLSRNNSATLPEVNVGKKISEGVKIPSEMKNKNKSKVKLEDTANRNRLAKSANANDKSKSNRPKQPKRQRIDRSFVLSINTSQEEIFKNVAQYIKTYESLRKKKVKLLQRECEAIKQLGKKLNLDLGSAIKECLRHKMEMESLDFEDCEPGEKTLKVDIPQGMGQPKQENVGLLAPGSFLPGRPRLLKEDVAQVIAEKANHHYHWR